MKKSLVKAFAVFLAFAAFFSYNIVESKAAPLDVSAKSAVLIEAATGRVLYVKNGYEQMPMASTTKVMTAIVALENGDIADMVEVSGNASGVEGSSIWLSAGEKMTLSNMLFGLMLASGNDAALAIAEHVGGSVENFVDMMNKKAQEIGAYNTHFVNPNGLPVDNHYTTAYDLALISAYAMQNDYFCEIVKTQYKTLPWEGHEWDRVVKNKNKILWNYEGGNGVKTGFTKAAGKCLSAAAKRDGMQLVAVVLNANDMFGDCMNMMDYGFENYQYRRILDAGSHMGDVKVEEGMEDGFSVFTEENVYYPLTESEYTQIEKRVFLEETMSAPIVKGQTVGYVDIWLGNNKLRSVELKSPVEVRENSYSYNLKRLFKFWIKRRLLEM